MEFYGNQLMDAFGSSSVSSGNSTEEENDLRKGPWTAEEDAMLADYVRVHGEGRWNNVAHYSGLKRTGKSCRLRWLNYLRPDVRRGNITLKEQLLILELHSRWGNRWSKIAKYLPGRTDNEIKNYWRTRVQKQAKQLKCDVNSQKFRDTMRYVWMPRLAERIRAAESTNQSINILGNNDVIETVDPIKPPQLKDAYSNHMLSYINVHESQGIDAKMMSEASGVSSDSSDIQVSSMSGITECTTEYDMSGNNNWGDYTQSGMGLRPDNQMGHLGWTDAPSFDIPGDEHCSAWFGGEDSLDSFWSEENIWFLKQQLSDEDLDL